MPLPLKPGENIYIDHKIKEASYAMPAMQAAQKKKQYMLKKISQRKMVIRQVSLKQSSLI